MESTVWFESGAISKKKPSLHAKYVSQPLLRFHPSFTPETWSTDPFVLFQNAIRHELQDLYIMLRSGVLNLRALQSFDALALQSWLVEFGQLVSIYFLVQERIIYPTVLRKGGRDRISVELLKSRTKPLLTMLVEVHKESLVLVETCQEREIRRAVSDDNGRVQQAFHRLSNMVADFASVPEAFFVWELTEVACVAARYLSKVESRAMEKRSISEILSYEVGERVFGGFSQCIPFSVKTQYLQGLDVLKLNRVRRKEKKWHKVHKSLQGRFANYR